jgi:hypothetical protein
MPYPLWTLFLKNVSKIPQLIFKKYKQKVSMQFK